MHLDINECNVTRPCNSLANCVNTIGSYQCGCQTGYSGDGISCIGKPIFCLHLRNMTMHLNFSHIYIDMYTDVIKTRDY